MIDLILYNETKYQEANNINSKLVAESCKSDLINWINIEISDIKEVEEIINYFNIHHLLIEDTINYEHLPKIEIFEDYIFVTLKILILNDDNILKSEHISLILGKNYVLSLQQGIFGDVFDDTRTKIKSGIGKVRKYSADFLFYMLIDNIVDGYFKIIETTRDEIQIIESNLFNNKNVDIIPDVAKLKNTVNQVRKFTIPLKDILGKLVINQEKFIKKSTIAYINDVVDHINHLLSSFENQREMLKDLLDLHQTKLNNETNKVMKILTIVSTIFIPLTFFAGIYGMNFKYMPELDLKWTYPLLLVLMVISALVMIYFMKKKKWF